MVLVQTPEVTEGQRVTVKLTPGGFDVVGTGEGVEVQCEDSEYFEVRIGETNAFQTFGKSFTISLSDIGNRAMTISEVG